MSAPTLITVKAAAELLGVSPSRVRQFYRPGGPLRKFENTMLGDVRVDRAEVIALREARATYRPVKVSA
jgi:hypothetical protein